MTREQAIAYHQRKYEELSRKLSRLRTDAWLIQSEMDERSRRVRDLYAQPGNVTPDKHWTSVYVSPVSEG